MIALKRSPFGRYALACLISVGISFSKKASEYIEPYTTVGDTAQSSEVMRAAQSEIPAAYAGIPGAV